jgi:hypothetical protein
VNRPPNWNWCQVVSNRLRVGVSGAGGGCEVAADPDAGWLDADAGGVDADVGLVVCAPAGTATTRQQTKETGIQRVMPSSAR